MAKGDTPREILNKKQLAEYLNVSVYTIDTWVSQRRIPFYKIGRRVLFRKHKILEWIENFKVEPVKILDFDKGI